MSPDHWKQLQRRATGSPCGKGRGHGYGHDDEISCSDDDDGWGPCHTPPPARQSARRMSALRTPGSVPTPRVATALRRVSFSYDDVSDIICRIACSPGSIGTQSLVSVPPRAL